MMAFGLFSLLLVSGGIIGKILTILQIVGVSTGLTTGFIILGVVSFMLGVFASIVFKRQSFSEKDLRHYVNEFKKYQNDLGM